MKALCARFGVDTAMLPRIVASHEIIGELTREMAKPAACRPGVPVVAGCGDTAASFLSCGATRAGICVDVAGTASVFACSVTDFKADDKDMVLSCGRSAVQGSVASVRLHQRRRDEPGVVPGAAWRGQ